MHRFSASSLCVTLKNVTLSCGHHCGYTLQKLKEIFQFMANVLGTLQNFYIQNILPEVLTRKIENSAPKIFDGQKDKLYCFCNSPYSSDETWIGCTQKNVNGSGFICHV